VNSDILESLAERLDRAMMEAREIERLTLAYPGLTLADAYLIQDAGIRKRILRGEKQIGFKMGLTSKAKQEQMNLRSPIYGVLTHQMEIQPKTPFSLHGKIHPKVEPEIAFILEKDIHGKVSFEEALEACSGVVPALEILDSRFLNFKYFSLPDVVADNCSSAYFLISDQILNPKDIDFSHLKMMLEINGKIVHEAYSNEISGHPLHSLVQLCEMLHDRDLILPKGSIVLAGAATQAVSLEEGMKVRLLVEKLGEVSFTLPPASK
jgi:2-oxo-3-hexenedioate decarboxylase